VCVAMFGAIDLFEETPWFGGGLGGVSQVSGARSYLFPFILWKIPIPAAGWVAPTQQHPTHTCLLWCGFLVFFFVWVVSHPLSISRPSPFEIGRDTFCVGGKPGDNRCGGPLAKVFCVRYIFVMVWVVVQRFFFPFLFCLIEQVGFLVKFRRWADSP